jgi:photosystem II stability/assembly factor-like uncharacterized protein
MAKGTQIFSNNDTRLWIQNDGVGTEFALYACHALTEWSQDFEETVFIKCKSSDQYGKKDIVETIPGEEVEPTFTVVAYTRQEADFLLGLQCPVDMQVFYGKCKTPSDPSGYIKIRHFYRGSKTSQGESSVDFLGDETPAGIMLTVELTAEEIIEILQVDVVSAATGVTEAQAFNDIAMLRDTRCEGGCGVEISQCEWGLAVSDSSYGVATANIWYTDDDGDNWQVTTTDPFADNDADVSTCVILPGETAPRFIVFRGNVDDFYAGRASISDDWGVTWAEVNMGGNDNGSYVNSAWAYSSGLIWAVGNAGRVWYSVDRGAGWSTVVTGAGVELWDIHSPDNDTYYIVGDTNTCYVSTDGGLTWAAVTTAPANANENLFTVQAPTTYRVIVGGAVDANDACMWVSTDGGATAWTAVAFTGSTTASGEVRRVRITDEAPLAHMIMIHGVNNGATRRYGAGTNFRFHRSLDGGATWERMDLVTNNGLNGLSVCNVNLAWAAGEPVGGVAVIQKMYAP